MAFVFSPGITVRHFMKDTRFVRGLIGPLGSGKSSGAIMELLRRAMEQAPNTGGVRQTRFAIIRNTLPMLKSTVLNDIRNYLGDLADWRVSDNTVYIRFRLEDGTRVDSAWMFVPLEDANDQRRLLSLQLTGAWIEEAREVPFAILFPLMGRCGRFPSMDAAPTWQGVILTSNPWPDGSDWNLLFEVQKPNGFVLYRQPSGLAPEAENVEHLPENYYTRLCEGASADYIKVHVKGENGPDVSGLAVFRDSFRYDYHTVWETQVVEGNTFILGVDTDRNPAALICQRSPIGQLLVHKEVFTQGMGLENFVASMLTPVMYERFAGHAYVIIDPSAARRSSITEESQVQAYQRLGYDTVLAPTNNIEPRLRSIEGLMLTALGGQPGLVISRSGCPMLIRALMMEYKYPRNAKGAIVPAPEKKHPWSDLCDALSYVALGFGSPRMGRAVGGGRLPTLGGRGGRPATAPDRRAWT